MKTIIPGYWIILLLELYHRIFCPLCDPFLQFRQFLIKLTGCGSGCVGRTSCHFLRLFRFLADPNGFLLALRQSQERQQLLPSYPFVWGLKYTSNSSAGCYTWGSYFMPVPFNSARSAGHRQSAIGFSWYRQVEGICPFATVRLYPGFLIYP